LHGSGVPATNQPDGTGTILMVLLIRAGADHSPDGGSGADHPPDGAGHPPQADQMIRMVLVLVSLIKLTKLISNKLWC
jgi:hypothetical protein